MDKQKVTKGLLKLVLGLSIIFAVLAFVYDQKQSQQQQTTQQQVQQVKHQQKNTQQKRQTQEKLVADAVYQKRAVAFLNRALARATKSGDISAKDETYGNADVYTAIQAMAGMNSGMKLTHHDLQFNKMADGEIVGEGQIEIEAFGISDDKKAKTRHVKSKFTVLLTLDQYQGQLRVESIKLGEVKASENAKDTVY
ncbi:hypothetical protein [Weissella thailandensis]|uniref:Lipoprotein n=1 Tax=Weissella thailandensis TaxID=89061 RepID=A0ABX9I7E2_9LACO|nr:hypothetical protein [Weissella thailandensis]NKY90088.1 hypothetical protein [Weissella thailandensis]RDS60165.1 hypothetical protein DWV05_01040 [Weissella thailandensis]GEP75000.1 hypothetical protein WTH01_12470 [Weissella thailandensis]